MKYWLVVALVGTVAGCSSAPTKLDRALQLRVGQNIALLSAAFGAPDTSRGIGADTQYMWIVDYRFTETQALHHLSSADVAESPSRLFMVHDVCNLQVIADQDDSIKSIYVKGNHGCQRFVTALDSRDL